MQLHKAESLPELLRSNPYPGRGILMGQSPAGKAIIAYFIMGRSQNSQNRVFYMEGGELRIRIHDLALVSDPSLILYRPLRRWGRQLILTNGDQTGTVYEALQQGGSFEGALRSRRFEPDAPHYTPRISGLMRLDQDGDYALSILRAADAGGEVCDRLFFEYAALPGQGRLIHTYLGDGNPLPSFAGEPRLVELPDDAQAFAAELWEALSAQNRVALFVQEIDLNSGKARHVIYNRHPL